MWRSTYLAICFQSVASFSFHSYFFRRLRSTVFYDCRVKSAGIQKVCFPRLFLCQIVPQSRIAARGGEGGRKYSYYPALTIKVCSVYNCQHPMTHWGHPLPLFSSAHTVLGMNKCRALTFGLCTFFFVEKEMPSKFSCNQNKHRARRIKGQTQSAFVHVHI